MADALFSKIQDLRIASFDLGSKSRFLNIRSKARFQTPLVAEDGIPFLEKWYRKPIALPLSLFAPTSDSLTEEEQRNLLEDFRSALHTLEDETGSQNLFLSIGFLRAQNTAPLLFVPVSLDAERLTVSLKNAAPVENVPLRIKSRESIELPPAKIFWDGSAFQAKKYFLAVERAVDAVAGWKSTSRGMFLGFFDAASLFAHQDCESEKWNDASVARNFSASELLSPGGFHVVDSDIDEKNPDDVFNPAEHCFVRPMDSEANTILVEALSSKNAIEVIETPPGSAKEDLAANLVSENVAHGKKVLVTYRKKISRLRLERILQSQVSIQSDTTLEKSRESLTAIRKILVDYSRAVNQPIPPGNSTLSESLVALDRISAKKVWPDSTFSGAENLSRENFLLVQEVIREILERQAKPDVRKALNAFKGLSLDSIDESRKAELLQKLQSASAKYQTLATLARSVSGDFSFEGNIDIPALSRISEAITPEFNSQTPSFEGWDLESKDWDTYEETLLALPKAGEAWSEFRRNGSPTYVPEAIDMQLGAPREVLRNSQNRKFRIFSEYYHDAKNTLLRTLKNPKSVKTDAELLDLTEGLVQLQESKKLYMNSSVMALHLFGKDWQFEHTDWKSLETKVQWLFAFRKKLSKDKTANLSLSILSRYSSIQESIPDASALSRLCQEASSEFETLCRELGLENPGEYDSVEEQAGLLRRWLESFSLISGYMQINARYRKLRELGLFNLEKALWETSFQKESITVDLSRFWNFAQIQNACKIFPQLFSVSPKAHSRYAKDFQGATDVLTAMNLKHFRETREKAPDLLAILSIDETATLSRESAFDIAICLDADATTPLQALPAIFRSRQTFLIGDANLPTPKFSQILDPAPRASFSAPHLENILSYSLYKGAKRSCLSLDLLHRHPLLVDFSNRNFYNRRIQVFPAPNACEAKPIQTIVEKDLPTAVAKAAARHLEQHPTRTLGIIVFTEERKAKVFEAIQANVSAHPELARFLSAKDPLQAPYVKRPEQAVGEYRDTLLVCAESGAAIAGQNVTPRHVNVCATHAVSSLTILAEEIPEKTVSSNPGVQSYLEFLHFAVNDSSTSLFHSNRISSPLEEEIFREIDHGEFSIERNWGYNDFTLPFAVHDANNPERFLLGIDTDSGNRFLSRSVEDRLYVRPRLFRQLGWKIISLWCPNWFRSTADERNHVLATIAVEQSVAPAASPKADKEESPRIQTVPYRIGKFPGEAGTPIPETDEASLVSQLRFYVESESPIHEKNLIRRVLHLHGLHRAGPAVVRIVKAAISKGIAAKAFHKTGSFFYSTGEQPIVLRDRSGLPDEERSLLYVSPEERSLFPPNTDEQTIQETLGLL